MAEKLFNNNGVSEISLVETVSKEILLLPTYIMLSIFLNDNQFIYFEVFDIEKFLDTVIESKIIIKLKD